MNSCAVAGNGLATDDDGVLVHERGKIAAHYLRGWFWLDIFSSLPYDLMLGSEYGLLKLLRVGAENPES
jgi:hypothetical protein